MEQKLVCDDGTIDGNTFDWCAYYTYWYCHHHQVRISFNATYHLEAEAHRTEALVTQTCHTTFMPPTGPPLVVTTPMTHVAGVDPTITPTPDPLYQYPAGSLPPDDPDDDAS